MSDKLVGIINGIDVNVWSPQKDELLKKTYNLKTFKKGKEANKKEVLKEFGLKDVKKPLFSMISRLTTQTGFDLLESVADKLSKLNVNIVVLGTGEKNYEMILSSLMEKYPETFSVKFEYNDALAHLIEAGSDMFLMPSKYEPCGLNQLYSLAYGTIPIVKGVGGLDDTIISYPDKNANGFKFYEHDSEKMFESIRDAVNLYNKDYKLFSGMIKTGMKADLSWAFSAKEYIKQYESLVK
jgi:starch synthase